MGTSVHQRRKVLCCIADGKFDISRADFQIRPLKADRLPLSAMHQSKNVMLTRAAMQIASNFSLCVFVSQVRVSSGRFV